MDYFDMISDTLDSMSMDAKDKFMDYLEFADINPTLMSMAEGLYAGFDKDMVAEQAGLKNRAVMMKYVPELREYLMEYCNTSVYLKSVSHFSKKIKNQIRIQNRLTFAKMLRLDGKIKPHDKILTETYKISLEDDHFIYRPLIKSFWLCPTLNSSYPDLLTLLEQVQKENDITLSYLEVNTKYKQLTIQYVSGEINKLQFLGKTDQLLQKVNSTVSTSDIDFHFENLICTIKLKQLEVKRLNDEIKKLCTNRLDKCKDDLTRNTWVYSLAIAYYGDKDFKKADKILTTKLKFSYLHKTNQAIALYLHCRCKLFQNQYQEALEIVSEIPESVRSSTKLGPFIMQMECQIAFGLGDFKKAKELILTMPPQISKVKDRFNLSNQLLLILCHHQLGDQKLAITTMRNLKRYCNRTVSNPQRKELYLNIIKVLPSIIYEKHTMTEILDLRKDEIAAIKDYYEKEWDPNKCIDVFKFHELLTSGFFHKNSAASSTEGQLA